VGLAILNAGNNVFVGKRTDQRPEAWQMPQGGIDEGESPLEAALRELYEETGLKEQHVTLLHTIPDWLYYDLPADLQPQFWGGKYKGQKQQWFVFRFTGQDTDINLDACEHAEFLEWQWLPPAQLPEVIVPFKREIYQQLANILQNIP
jgi:putative (di)nucleoside polyphosphate hydrolase